jgi:hypothetical protein
MLRTFSTVSASFAIERAHHEAAAGNQHHVQGYPLAQVYSLVRGAGLLAVYDLPLGVDGHHLKAKSGIGRL